MEIAIEHLPGCLFERLALVNHETRLLLSLWVNRNVAKYSADATLRFVKDDNVWALTMTKPYWFQMMTAVFRCDKMRMLPGLNLTDAEILSLGMLNMPASICKKYWNMGLAMPLPWQNAGYTVPCTSPDNIYWLARTVPNFYHIFSDPNVNAGLDTLTEMLGRQRNGRVIYPKARIIGMVQNNWPIDKVFETAMFDSGSLCLMCITATMLGNMGNAVLTFHPDIQYSLIASYVPGEIWNLLGTKYNVGWVAISRTLFAEDPDSERFGKNIESPVGFVEFLEKATTRDAELGEMYYQAGLAHFGVVDLPGFFERIPPEVFTCMLAIYIRKQLGYYSFINYDRSHATLLHNIIGMLGIASGIPSNGGIRMVEWSGIVFKADVEIGSVKIGDRFVTLDRAIWEKFRAGHENFGVRKVCRDIISMCGFPG